MNNAPQNKDCPPLMSDGRHATDYRPSCYVHNLINEQNSLTNSHQQRLFLQRNAEQLMKLNHAFFQDKAGCNTCKPYHVDPNGHDAYWASYKKNLAQKQGL